MQEERFQVRACKRFKGSTQGTDGRIARRLADLHDDVKIVVVELLHHVQVRGAVLA